MIERECPARHGARLYFGPTVQIGGRPGRGIDLEPAFLPVSVPFRFMHVSGNIIRFPVQPVSPLLSERDQEEAAKIVGFPTPEVDESAMIELQERGQVFAAHRIISRVADQLDSIAAL